MGFSSHDGVVFLVFDYFDGSDVNVVYCMSGEVEMYGVWEGFAIRFVFVVIGYF